MEERIAIVGGGLVGSLLTLYLAQRGYPITLFERRPDIRRSAFMGGRSINLALSDRGWLALEKVGMAEEIRRISIPMNSRLIHSTEGELSRQPYGKEGQAIYSVSRADLNRSLLDAASGKDNVSMNFEHPCVDLDPDSDTLYTEDLASGNTKPFVFTRLFGTDGAFSAVRSRLQKMDRRNFSQEYLSHGYKELNISPSPDGTHRMEKHALHIWPRNEYMLIALPNLDGSFTVTLFFPFEGPVSFEALNSPKAVSDFFLGTFPDVVPLIPDLGEQFFENPTSSLVMIKNKPWHLEDKICLLGDAAHAIVPFYGQGMNAGFEDCRIFDEILNRYPGDWARCFQTFSETRKPDADAILELALRNYIEMRDKTVDPEFILQKKIERWFADRHPDKWTPLYSQVTFSHIPYHLALRNGDVQDDIMRKVMALPEVRINWECDEVEQTMLSLLD